MDCTKGRCRAKLIRVRTMPALTSCRIEYTYSAEGASFTGIVWLASASSRAPLHSVAFIRTFETLSSRFLIQRGSRSFDKAFHGCLTSNRTLFLPTDHLPLEIETIFSAFLPIKERANTAKRVVKRRGLSFDSSSFSREYDYVSDLLTANLSTNIAASMFARDYFYDYGGFTG